MGDEVSIVGDQHAAARGGDDFVAVEGETGEMRDGETDERKKCSAHDTHTTKPWLPRILQALRNVDNSSVNA